jgi:hypothetical protein
MTKANTDIWFALCVGEIDCDSSGRRRYMPAMSSEQRLTLAGVRDLGQYRLELHLMLDRAIGNIDRDMKAEDD